MKATHVLRENCRFPFEKSIYDLLDVVATVLLALLPLLQHYKSFFQDASTVLMPILFVYFGIRMLLAKEWHFVAMLPMLAFSAYELFNHGVGLTEFAREALLMGYCVVAASRVINLKMFSRIVVCVACVASALIILQYICYYVFGFHLQLVATGLLKARAQQWVLLAQTGRFSVSGKWMEFYRPSAFFLEPSHFTLYCFPALALVLLNKEHFRMKWVLSGLLSIGIIFTTSGMGIALVFGIWALYLLRHFMGDGTLVQKLKNLVKPRALLVYGILLALAVAAYVFVPVFRQSINRIFLASSNTGKNAIEGRMGTGIKMISRLRGWEFWFGKASWGNVHNWNMAGFFYTFYTQGLLGALLSYAFYVRSIFKLKDARFWIAVILVGLSFVTLQTHAAFFMFFYVLILMEGYNEKEDKWVIKNKLSDYFTGLLSRKKEDASGGK